MITKCAIFCAFHAILWNHMLQWFTTLWNPPDERAINSSYSSWPSIWDSITPSNPSMRAPLDQDPMLIHVGPARWKLILVLHSLTRDPLYSHPTNHLDVVPTERKIWSPTSSIYEGCTGWPSILPFCTHLHVTDSFHSIHPSAMVPLDEISYAPTHVHMFR